MKPKDLQASWQEYVGGLFQNSTILDIGSGYGQSRERLSNNGSNTVLTHDVNNAMQGFVDIVCDVKGLWKHGIKHRNIITKNNDDKINLITAFDVLEHVSKPISFLNIIKHYANNVFISVPSYPYHKKPWAFKPSELIWLFGKCDLRVAGLYGRVCYEDKDFISSLSMKDFLNDDWYAYGVWGCHN